MVTELPAANALKAAVATLLADPASDLTRKRQTHVLTASFVTVLISTEVVVLKTGGLATLTFELNQPQVRVILHTLLAGICAYLLTTYCFALWHDRKRYDYVSVSAWTAFKQFAGTIIGEQQVLNEKRDRLIADVMDYCNALKLTAAVDAKYARVIEDLTRQRNILIGTPEGVAESSELDPKEATAPFFEEVVTLESVSTELDRISGLRDSEQAALKDARQLLAASIQGLAAAPEAQRSAAAAMNNLKAVLDDMRRVSRYRKIFDIAIPTMFAVFAVVIALSTAWK